MIEARFAAAPACGHCHSERIGPWGLVSGLQRYKCKECRRTFNALTGTPLEQLHRREVKSYLGWFRMIEREGEHLTPRRSIACALC